MEELVETLKVLFWGIVVIFVLGFLVRDDEVRLTLVIGRMFNKIKEFVSKNLRLVIGLALLIFSAFLLIMIMNNDKKSIAFWAFLGIFILLAGVISLFIELFTEKNEHIFSVILIALGAGIYASSILCLAFNEIIILIYGAKTSHLISIKDFLLSLVLPMFTTIIGFFFGNFNNEETNRKNDSQLDDIKKMLISIDKKISRNDINNQEEKAEKPFYKKWWFWLIIIIVIATIAYISCIICSLIHVSNNVDYIVKLATPFVALIAAIGAIISYFIKNESEKEDRENTRKIQVHSEAQWRKRLFDLVEKEELTKNDVIYFLSFFNSNNPTSAIDKLMLNVCSGLLEDKNCDEYSKIIPDINNAIDSEKNQQKKRKNKIKKVLLEQTKNIKDADLDFIVKFLLYLEKNNDKDASNLMGINLPDKFDKNDELKNWVEKEEEKELEKILNSVIADKTDKIYSEYKEKTNKEQDNDEKVSILKEIIKRQVGLVIDNCSLTLKQQLLFRAAINALLKDDWNTQTKN